MATAQVSSDLHKPSFAKIAASASASADNLHPLAARPVSGSMAQPQVPGHAPIVVGTPVIANGGIGKTQRLRVAPGPSSSSSPRPAEENMGPTRVEPIEQIAVGSKDVHIAPRMPSLVVNGSGVSLPDRKALIRDGVGSDESQKADSSSELGTKPPSLDGKSVTSGTTFALDEKESLRPDDSASVKAAAAEDDDALSFHNSIAVGSRVSSDIAARVRGIQLGDMGRQPSQTASSAVQGIATPQSANSGQQPIPTVAVPDALNTIYSQTPDDKLVEAMQSPKDRIFLLRLEKQVIDFVQHSKEPFMDLPPCNSFCRMLTHKLADYYHMTHSYEQTVMSVRIFRTPFCRVPPSLATIVDTPSATNTPPPAKIQKIIRRGEDCEIGPSSRGASKPTSEVGSDGKEKAAAPKEKMMSREEREEAYRVARERIFGTEEEDPSPDAEENVSSRPGSGLKDKVGGQKPRGGQRRPPKRNSPPFENQTAFGTAYPQGPHQVVGWSLPPHGQQLPYVPVGGQGQGFNGQGQQQFPGAQMGPPMHGPMYGPPNPNFPPMQNMGYAPYNMPQYSQTPPQRFPHLANNGVGGYGPASPQPGWQGPQQQFNGPTPQFAPRGAANHPPGGMMGSSPAAAGIPYAYGQLPANANPHDPKSQHPIPGSYNRHAFNPSTKSFVPANGVPPMQGQGPMSYPAPGSHHSSPQVASPHLAYAAGGFQPNMVPPPAMHQSYGSPAHGYTMVRQGSNNSMGPYHHSPQHVQGPPLPTTAATPQQPQHIPPHPPQIPNKPPVPQGPGQQQFSHLPPHYGNPALLPPKPT